MTLSAGLALQQSLIVVLFSIESTIIEIIPFLNNVTKIPLFVQFFVIFMSIYHSVMFIMLKEIHTSLPSRVWNNLTNANFVGIALTVFTASLLNELYNVSIKGHYILIFAAIFDIVTHYCANFGIYYLIKPIIKEKFNFFRTGYLFFYGFLAILLYSIVNVAYMLHYPPSTYFIVLGIFILFSMLVIIYSSYSLLFISKSYAEIGFVGKPFLVGGIGMVSYLLSVGLVIFFIIGLKPETQSELYYNISLYAIFFVFTILYFLRFIIEYPSILQPKWKTLMPIDFPKVTAAITLAFLATSLYFSAKGSPQFIIYQDITYILIIAFLLPMLLGIIMTFTYLRTVSESIKSRYWEYLSYGLYSHLAITLYVFSLIFLVWNTAPRSTKMLCILFGIVSFAVYLFFALFLHNIVTFLRIKSTFGKLNVTQYTVSFCSLFFIIFFGVSLTYRETVDGMGFGLVSYPGILFAIATSLNALGVYLNVRRKSFEEIRGMNIWNTVIYISVFGAFLLVYLIYSSLRTFIQHFPYHDCFFIGYFLMLVLWIASTRSLRVETTYKRTGEGDIVRLLNSRAHSFLRTDYLEALWEKTVNCYIREDEALQIGFDPSQRRFDLEQAAEPTRVKVAVAILLGMHTVGDTDKIVNKSLEETKEEIAEILNEKILMLPDDLRSQFDEEEYYPILFERVINKLIRHLETFIHFSEQEKIFSRLAKKDERYTCISFERDTIRLKEETRFSRSTFFELFKLYLESIEGKFPFQRFLLYELVREEIKKELEPYDITVGDILDIVPTGIGALDEVMAGGLPKGSSTLLIAEETKLKDKIILSFIKQGLSEGNNVIYATSKQPSQEVIRELNMDFEDLTNFMIIDLYENIHTEKRVSYMIEEKRRIIIPLSTLLFRRSVVKTIKSCPREFSKRVVIDVYDNFSRYYVPAEVLEILEKQLEGFKRWNCTSVIILDPHSYLIKTEGEEEVKKHFDNVMILSGDATVFIEKLYHGTPSKPVIRLP